MGIVLLTFVNAVAAVVLVVVVNMSIEQIINMSVCLSVTHCQASSVTFSVQRHQGERDREETQL